METRENISDQNFNFPEEILLEILVKLPFKSLSRFKCVSKNWLSLISSPSFFSFFVSRSKDSPCTLVFQCDQYTGIHSSVSTGNILDRIDSQFVSNQIPGLKVVATSNDLILYRSYHESVYFVANPYNSHIVRLPMHSRRKSCSYIGFVSFVRNRITSYNVVRLIKDCDNTLSLEMFSSEIGEWRSFKPRNCTFNLEFDARPCIVFRGVVHWICNRMTTILAYDPPDKCRFIAVPNEVYSTLGMNAILGVSCDGLYYFEMSRISVEGCKFPGWKLWELKEYEKGEWRLVKEANETKVEAFLCFLPNVILRYSALLPLAFHPWNKDIVYFSYEGYILIFNVEKGSFEYKFSTFPSKSNACRWEIFPLLMPFCPTQISEPQWDGSIAAEKM